LFARFSLLVGLPDTNKTVLVKMILGNGSEGYALRQGALYRMWPRRWALEQLPDPSTRGNCRGRRRGRRRRSCRSTGGSNHGVCLNQR